MKRKLWLAVIGAFAVGFLTLFLIRFTQVKSDAVHYHANFALYINGEREQFDNFTYYEEIASCSDSDSDNPKTRVHMHNNINSVVHVHDHAATWGAFFANLGMTLGDSLIKTDNGIFVNDQDGKKLTFTLNNQLVQTVANRAIKSEDVLLISYGDPIQTDLGKEYASIKQDAGDYNSKVDPSSCSGGKTLTWQDRFKKALEGQ